MGLGSRGRAGTCARLRRLSDVGVLLLSLGVPGNLGAVAAARAPAAVRDVTPPGVLRVYRSKQEPDFLPDGAKRYANVRVGEDAVLQTAEGRLRLYAITLPARRKICRTATGARWACGQRALMALRNLLDEQVVACVTKDTATVPTSVCRVQNMDVSAWMLREGWADLAEGVRDKIYVEAQSAAQARKAGLWSLDPP
jgi:endonuclease YncB( thermonuclease family)